MTPVFQLERNKSVRLMSVPSRLVETTLKNSTSEHSGKWNGWKRKLDSAVCRRQWYSTDLTKILKGIEKHEGDDIHVDLVCWDR